MSAVSPAVHTLHCHCGAVVMQLHGTPAVSAICHCSACRDLYGSIVLAATAWLPGQLSHVGDPDMLLTYRHPTRQMQRTTCRRCGELVHGSNRFDYAVVPNARFLRQHDGRLPDELAPTMHLFYAYRMFDIADTLPKYLEGWDGPLYATPQG